MIVGVPAAEYAARDQEFRPFLERIERHDKDGITADEYSQLILNRDYQLWDLSGEAIALTKVTWNAVRLEWVVGKNRHKWQEDLDDVLRQWGRSLGKKRLIVLARPGWAKLADKLGYKEIQRAYEAVI